MRAAIMYIHTTASNKVAFITCCIEYTKCLVSKYYPFTSDVIPVFFLKTKKLMSFLSFKNFGFCSFFMAL